MDNETISKTLIVAALLSIVCSTFVSSSAVLLRPNQAKNKDLDRKKNILMAAGLYEEGRSVEELFGKFEIRVIDLATGAYADDMDASTFDQKKASKSPDTNIEIAPGDGLSGIKQRSKFALVYLSRAGDGTLQQLVLPVHGKGLWSTMYGFLALDRNLTTINGFAFYQHGETPGLGGEVDNPRWKAQWVGKEAFGADGGIRIEVLKGRVNSGSPDLKHQVDGLAGATITTRGIDNLLQYWLGKNGFGPFLSRIKMEEIKTHG
jgi:Na+-transporting NADH:ubiquinone oxidoreductase subunit C